VKIFSVSIRVNITQVGEVMDSPESPASEENVPPTKFNDDPVDKQEKMLNSYMDRIERMQSPSLTRMPFAAPPSDSHQLTETVRITANTFEDLQAILSRFHAVAKELQPVPDSLLREPNFIPSVPAFPQYG
jgi:hypothetical protein